MLQSCCLEMLILLWWEVSSLFSNLSLIRYFVIHWLMKKLRTFSVIIYSWPFGLSAKVRRLYDIANVLSSINLIEKVHIFLSLKSHLVYFWKLQVDFHIWGRSDWEKLLVAFAGKQLILESLNMKYNMKEFWYCSLQMPRS